MQNHLKLRAVQERAGDPGSAAAVNYDTSAKQAGKDPLWMLIYFLIKNWRYHVLSHILRILNAAVEPAKLTPELHHISGVGKLWWGPVDSFILTHLAWWNYINIILWYFMIDISMSIQNCNKIWINYVNQPGRYINLYSFVADDL